MFDFILRFDYEGTKNVPRHIFYDNRRYQCDSGNRHDDEDISKACILSGELSRIIIQADGKSEIDGKRRQSRHHQSNNP